MNTSDFDAVLNLLILVVAVTFLSRQFKLPYSIALIFAGVAAALTPRIYSPYLPPDLLLAVLLPPILFDSALRLDIQNVTRDASVILSYAVIGTLMTMIAVTFLSYFFLGFSFYESLILGIAIAPTDPVAVISTFKTQGASHRFRTIVECESLFNDGVAVIAYSIVATILTRGSVSIPETLGSSAVAIFGGLSIGALGGYIVHYLIKRIDDMFTEVMIGFLLSFGVYRLAENITASGVLSTVAAGLVLNYQLSKKGGLSGGAVQRIGVFWEFVSFIITSLAFILIGIYLDVFVLFKFLLPALGLLLFIIIFRYLKVIGLSRLISRVTNNYLSYNWCMGLLWSGLRGVVSVLIILGSASLPLPNIEEMKALVFGVVLGTNLIWGVSMAYAVQRFKLTDN